MLSGMCLARYRHLSNRPRPRSQSLNVLAISAIPASKEVENEDDDEDEDDWGSTLSALTVRSVKKCDK